MSTSTAPTLSRETMQQFVNYFGIQFGGDIGGWTCYRNKNGKAVFFPRTTPAKPPTAAQIKQRLRFKLAQSNWKNLSATLKQSWELFCRKLSLCMTGQNLFISTQLVDQSDKWPAAVQKTSIHLTYPAVLPP